MFIDNSEACKKAIKEAQEKWLYAVGELSSAIEGANRLGGNSVGGALVFGNNAVKSAEASHGFKCYSDINKK